MSVVTKISSKWFVCIIYTIHHNLLISLVVDYFQYYFIGSIYVFRLLYACLVA
jgi:hypothetical protein